MVIKLAVESIKMENKIPLLLAVAIFLALSSIQSYLIYNTYKLEKQIFLGEVKNSVIEIYPDKELNVLLSEWNQNIAQQLRDRFDKSISKPLYLNKGLEVPDEFQNVYTKDFAGKLKKLDNRIKYQKRLKAIILSSNSGVDTIFSESEAEKILLAGESFNINDGELLTAHTYSQVTTEPIGSEDSTEEENFIEVETVVEDYILIQDIIISIFHRMTGLLLASIVIFILVVLLFYYSFRSLHLQKNIADVKTEIVNNITHEIKTPLATLGVATKSLRLEETRNCKIRHQEIIEVLERQNSRLKHLSDQVLQSSIDFHHVPLKLEMVNAQKFMNQLIQDFQLAMKKENLVLNSNIKLDEVRLSLDTFHFTTALQNILENAVKYNQMETKVIKFTASYNSKGLTVEILDNGIGILKKDLNDIFTKFFRVYSSSTIKSQGLGLGLFYAKKVIEAHKGCISVKSRYGNGSHFTVEIPYHEKI